MMCWYCPFEAPRRFMARFGLPLGVLLGIAAAMLIRRS